MTKDPDDYDPSLEPLEDDEQGWAELMCSMGPDGFCGQAGSEYCELECPYRGWQ